MQGFCNSVKRLLQGELSPSLLATHVRRTNVRSERSMVELHERVIRRKDAKAEYKRILQDLDGPIQVADLGNGVQFMDVPVGVQSRVTHLREIMHDCVPDGLWFLNFLETEAALAQV